MLSAPSNFIKDTQKFIQKGIPFFFMVDYQGKDPLALPFDLAKENGILFEFGNQTNHTPIETGSNSGQISLEIEEPLGFLEYEQKFKHVHQQLLGGNSFLLNLCVQTPLKGPLDLTNIYAKAKAPFKVLIEDRFVCFSPEPFIEIKDGRIYSYPMKGTIDADIPNAKNKLLKDPKEIQEHNTIVDLIRNDLSMVARDVTVERFRYLDHIQTTRGNILQTSSKISGALPKDWKGSFAEILFKLLPAGSISGAPKPKTVEIIEGIEGFERGFFTGVFGIFDGGSVQSAVAIRFVEKHNDLFWYKSGGGITHNSRAKEEYDEMLNKVYVPIV